MNFKFWKKTAAEVPAVAPAQVHEKKPSGISAESVRLTAQPAQMSFDKAFKLPDVLPGVVPAGSATMATDSDISGAYAWANSGMFNEGMGFLGYPYLSELSQRPEYRRIAETIAKEMTRKWMKLISVGSGDDGKTEKLKQLEAAMKKLKVQSAFRKAAELDSYFGRAHIYLDTGDSDDAEELKTTIGNGNSKLTKVKISPKHPLKRVSVIEPVWTYPNAYNSSDPLKSDYFNPVSWFVQGKLIHSTRLLSFVGRPVPDLLKPAYSFGGLAMSQMAKPYVDNWLRTRQAVSDLIYSFSTQVLSTDMGSVLTGGGADQIIYRAQMFNQMRDNRGLMMINKDTETFGNVSVPLSGLDHLQAQSQEHMSSVSGIPLVKLLGVTPSGLNASSDGEMRCFYDWIEAQQESLFTDNLSVILNLVQLSEFGEIDPDIGFKWEPLWTLDESQLAAARKTEADTDVELINAGVITPQESRTRIAADEDSAYASLDLTAEIEPPAAEPGQEDLFGSEPDGQETQQP